MRSADEIRRDLDTEEGQGALRRLSPIGRLVADVPPLLDALEAAQRENERLRAAIDSTAEDTRRYVSDHLADARAERDAAQRERDEARAEAEVNDGVARMVADDRDEALANLEAAEAERDAAVAREARLRAAVETLRDDCARQRPTPHAQPNEITVAGVAARLDLILSAAALASVPPETGEPE